MANASNTPPSGQCLLVDLGRYFVVMLILLIMLLQSQLPRYRTAQSDPRQRQLIRKINPNHDPWWMLAALPRIGVTRAKEIVQYREQSGQPHPFNSENDLLNLPGIGSATLHAAGDLIDYH
ncbi:MAG: hypothetical protein HJJLKODD_02925 [Phycisphaerae bacterium]|nr:hypothetical protein [Phycisphaerae bacterium]